MQYAAVAQISSPKVLNEHIAGGSREMKRINEIPPLCGEAVGIVAVVGHRHVRHVALELKILAAQSATSDLVLQINVTGEDYEREDDAMRPAITRHFLHVRFVLPRHSVRPVAISGKVQFKVPELITRYPRNAENERLPKPIGGNPIVRSLKNRPVEEIKRGSLVKLLICARPVCNVIVVVSAECDIHHHLFKFPVMRGEPERIQHFAQRPAAIPEIKVLPAADALDLVNINVPQPGVAEQHAIIVSGEEFAHFPESWIELGGHLHSGCLGYDGGGPEQVKGIGQGDKRREQGEGHEENGGLQPHSAHGRAFASLDFTITKGKRQLRSFSVIWERRCPFSKSAIPVPPHSSGQPPLRS